MKLANYIDDHCPDYALSYLINADASGLEQSEIDAIDAWDNANRESLKKAHPDATIDLVFSEDRNEFSPYPAFGLACATVHCAHVAYVPDESPLDSMRLPWQLEQTPAIHVSDITSQDYLGCFETEGDGGGEWHAVKIAHPSGLYVVAGTACNAGLLPSYARPFDPDFESMDEALQELVSDIEALPHPSGDLLEWHGSMVI